MAANQRQDADDYRREAEQADDEADVQLGAEMIALAIATAEAFGVLPMNGSGIFHPKHKKKPRPPRDLGESPRHCQPARGPDTISPSSISAWSRANEGHAEKPRFLRSPG